MKEKLRAVMARVTGYLWIPAAYLFYLTYVEETSYRDEPDDLFALLDNINRVSYDEMAVWCLVAIVFSLANAIAKWRKLRGEKWCSLITWSSAVGVLAGWLATVDWIPRVTDYLDLWIFEPATLEIVLVSWVGVFLEPVFWIAAPILYGVVAIHSDKVSNSSIGGGWKAPGTIAIGVLTLALVTAVNPIEQYIYFAHGSDRDETASVLSLLFSLILSMSALMLPLISALAVTAWKSRARLTMSEESFIVGFGEGLNLLTVPWNKVLSTTEIVQKQLRQSLIIEFGKLPWYRLRFGLIQRRDGSELLDEISNKSPLQKTTELRRGTKFAGYFCILIALASVLTMKLVEMKSTELMTGTAEYLLEHFAEHDHYLLFGVLMGTTALFVGLGVGLLFAPNYGSVRAWPLLGVACVAFFLPDPLLYWLVYIAIYAILLARLGPIEAHPHIPFADLSAVDFGMGVMDARAYILVAGYLLGTLFALKSWRGFLPAWPYKSRRSDTPLEHTSSEDG